MPAGCVDCIVTNAPPWTLTGHDQPTPDLYVTSLRRVCAEAHRVLANEGTLWLGVGDQYVDTSMIGRSRGRHTRRIRDQRTGQPRSLAGLPWQIAFALQDDGWIIRNAIVCHSPD